MKVAVAQNNYHIGNFEQNFAKIKQSVEKAKASGADLVIFSELAVCGYPPRDFLEFRDFIHRSDDTVAKIAALADNIAIVVGAPSVNPSVEGKDLFNSAYFLAEQKVQHVAHKALLPTYDIFDEYRYFEPCREFNIVEYKGKKIALTVCEDIWNVGNENPLYTLCPMDELIKHQPDFMINVSASPFDYNQHETRLKILKANADKYGVPIFYVNHIGSQTELIFDGGSLVSRRDGSIYRQLANFEEDFGIIDLEELSKTGPDHSIPQTKTTAIHDALVLGIRDYFQKLGFKKAILGLSGGIDSALTLALAAKALGPENVLAVLMPSQFSSDHSVDDSLELVKNLGTPHKILPITPLYDQYLESLSADFQDTDFGIAEENIQARTRAVLLMALSNKFGYILLNTSNKSEGAVGYSTLYGDMCGGLSVLGDVYKTEVYELAHYINREQEIIPENIINKAPSAELRPNQKDTDSLPEYAELDQLLYQYIELRKGPDELEEMGFDRAFIDRVLKLVNTTEYKRYQTPPILRVSPKAFGMGRRIPIVAKYLS